MKKTLRLLFLLSLLCAVLVLAASAVESPAVSDVATGANVAFTDANYNKLNVTYNGSDLDGDFYVVLVVKGTAESHPISGSSILYIDLVEKDAVNGVVFTADDDPVKSNPVYPKSVSDSVVLLGGDFGEGTSPKVIATIDAPAVEMSGTVKYAGALKNKGTAHVAVYDSGDSLIDEADTATDGTYKLNIPEGEGFYLKITKAGYLTYTYSGIDVTSTSTDLPLIDLSLLGGDVNNSKGVYSDDFTSFLKDFNKKDPTLFIYAGSDLNDSGAVYADDFSILLAGFNKTEAKHGHN